MKCRRSFALTLLVLGIPGCTRDDVGVDGGGTDGPGDDSDRNMEDCWPEMCEGSTLLEVTVDRAFGGEVVLSAECREDDRPVTPGSTEAIERDQESESCSITLYVDGEGAYSDDVPGYQRTSLRVTETGEIEAEHVVY